MGSSSTTHGYTAAGYPSSNVIDKFAFATDGNATDVGDLTITRSNGTGVSSTTHGYTTGGYPYTDVIEKHSFTIDGNATDVGNLTSARYTPAGTQH